MELQAQLLIATYCFASCAELSSIMLLSVKPNILKVTICLTTFQEPYQPCGLLTAVNVRNSLPCPSVIFEGNRPLKNLSIDGRIKIKYILNTWDEREWT
jgi:hypothetical protein